MRQPFPLAWPEAWPRTPAANRLRSKFGHRSSGQVSLYGAIQALVGELDRLGAANKVITSDLPTRNDGTPYADGRAADPGIAAWFVLDGAERVFACDKWLSHAENMQAIALSIEAMRGLSRWGAGDVVQRAFSGFAALPPGAAGSSSPPPPPTPRKKPWREVLGLTANTFLTLSIADQLVLAKARHRELIKKFHPDVAGGSHERSADINNALADCERDLGAHS